MKILMLGWELPPHNSGGLGVACYQLCKALAAHGCTIDFVVPYNEPHPNIDFMRVIPALPFSARKARAVAGIYDSHKYIVKEFYRPGMEDHLPRDMRGMQMRYGKAVQQLAKRNQYDIIHAHEWLTYEAAIAARQSSRAPVIAHVHATEFDRSGENSGNPLVHEIEEQGLLMADHIIAVSQHTKNIVARGYNIPEDKIEVVHNSVDQADFAPLAEANMYAYLQQMKQRGYTVVVSVNRLTVQKGMTYFLQAAKRALQKEPKLLFLICGSGEQYEELVTLSAQLGISQNVLFAGFVRGKAWRDAYGVADMFVMPSVSEPFGLVALEAVGYGNIALISKQSGACEVLKNVLTFDYWDTAKLAEYIVAVASNKGLHATLQQNAAQEFKHLSWDNIAKKCHSLYQLKVAGSAA